VVNIYYFANCSPNSRNPLIKNRASALSAVIVKFFDPYLPKPSVLGLKWLIMRHLKDPSIDSEHFSPRECE